MNALYIAHDGCKMQPRARERPNVIYHLSAFWFKRRAMKNRTTTPSFEKCIFPRFSRRRRSSFVSKQTHEALLANVTLRNDCSVSKRLLLPSRDFKGWMILPQLMPGDDSSLSRIRPAVMRPSSLPKSLHKGQGEIYSTGDSLNTL